MADVAAVQSIGVLATQAGAGTTTVLSVSKTVTVGNLIVVAWGAFTSGITLTGVTDNLGNTYTVRETASGGNGRTSGIASSRITAGGSLTTITASHSSGIYRIMSAAEFSAGGMVYAAGAGTNGSSDTPGTWVTNKTIPARGAAFGAFYASNARTGTAGASSGSPSTAIVAYNAGADDAAIALLYALGGSSDVTAFTGTVAWTGGTTPWGCSGFTIDGEAAATTRDPMGMSGFFGG